MAIGDPHFIVYLLKLACIPALWAKWPKSTPSTRRKKVVKIANGLDLGVVLRTP